MPAVQTASLPTSPILLTVRIVGDRMRCDFTTQLRKGKEIKMPFVTGSFSGKITRHSALPLTDQPNHDLSIGEVVGTQKSDDPLWNDANITYWAITDLIDGEGSQRGYYKNVHGDKGHEWGTFEGKVTGGGTTVEGTWKITAGDGEFGGVTGSGNFKTMMKSETDIEATWDGKYELARKQSA